MATLRARLPGRQAIKATAARALQACGALDKARRKGGLLIFMLHKVNDRPDGLGMTVSPVLLDRIVQEVRRYHEVVDLPGLSGREDAVSGKALRVAFTFDDGYRDNYDQAYPVLLKYGIPATIYVSVDYLDGKRSFWFERLADLIGKTCAERLDMTTEGLGTYDLADAPTRQRAMVDLNRRLKQYPEAQRERLLETMMRRLGVTGANPLSPMLNWQMVREMAVHGVSIGSHTLSHVILSRESIARVRTELRDSKARLEGILNAEVTSFAYPNGTVADFNATVIAEVGSAGYDQACTTIPGINQAGASPFTLRRVNLHANMCTDGAGRFEPALFWSRALGVM